MDKKIYVDRLRNGETQKFSCSCTAEELELIDESLRFATLVRFQICAYTTDDHLILSMDIQTTAQIPCKICNEWTDIAINIQKQTHAEALENIRSRVYDPTPLLIENIVLEVPQFAECQENCPERLLLKGFLGNS
ncbi:MAG: hypothetical protein SNF33_05650 [Candidatus Algichlamydia australiensis]|nr:hypothetical protein [Chlamydiales bacterium]